MTDETKQQLWYFAAHAPDVPEWYEIRESPLPIYSGGCLHMDEPPMDRLIRWRWEYAQRMMEYANK